MPLFLTLTLRFQSTLPAWGVTYLVGGDGMVYRFQSTLPAWGVTWAGHTVELGLFQFQSTLPAWGVTTSRTRHHTRPTISIHTPRMGSDHEPPMKCFHIRDFNPHSPHGE